MKTFLKFGVVATLVILLVPVVTVTAVPPQGQQFYGTVTFDDAQAPDGMAVTAEMNGRQVASTTVVDGVYGYSTPFIISTIDGDQAGDTINFFVNGYDAGSTSFSPGATTPRNLSASTPAPPEEDERVLAINVNGNGTTNPSPGSHNYDRGQTVNITAIPSPGWVFIGWTGSTVGDPTSNETTVRMTVNKTITANFELGIDETPPVISTVFVSNVTKDSADITWITDEPTTSQVDYAASPGELTPLDENLVTSHTVHLSGLTPATTYTFTVMSMDGSGNLATDGPYTFTTRGQPAAFQLSDWDISLTPSGSGYNVEFSLLLSNIGDLPGSYDVILTIDGIEADSETVELDGNSDRTIVLSATNATPGVHSAEISGVNLEFTIASESGTNENVYEPTADGINWGLILAVIAGSIMLTLIVAILFLRSKYTFVAK